ncbi:hypothetical protein SAMN05216551_109107 [Chitinasiproducens palmae]|uniref:Uncharacterized protein n=1 Tax=Chitinasiproducens palmae TaxID=1770053 RepID=A0A1H2PS35_9BURK|nr:hypothetical protein SAMN05216551_109107 [Chitinasiproducens palmae]
MSWPRRAAVCVRETGLVDVSGRGSNERSQPASQRSAERRGGRTRIQAVGATLLSVPRIDEDNLAAIGQQLGSNRPAIGQQPASRKAATATDSSRNFRGSEALRGPTRVVGRSAQASGKASQRLPVTRGSGTRSWVITAASGVRQALRRRAMAASHAGPIVRSVEAVRRLATSDDAASVANRHCSTLPTGTGDRDPRCWAVWKMTGQERWRLRADLGSVYPKPLPRPSALCTCWGGDSMRRWPCVSRVGSKREPLWRPACLRGPPG